MAGDLSRGSPAAAGRNDRAFRVHVIGSDAARTTPLEEDDLDGLIPRYVATRTDLDVVEFENITKALPWAQDQARRRGPTGVLAYRFLFDLHRRMFGDVWSWAGTLRTRATNIGAPPEQIVTRTWQALDDATFWHQEDAFEVDERAARIHRRLVAVHPFRNGNGRCTRLVADLYLTSVDAPAFTWGAGALAAGEHDVRRRYLDALRAADEDDYEPLVAFART